MSSSDPTHQSYYRASGLDEVYYDDIQVQKRGDSRKRWERESFEDETLPPPPPPLPSPIPLSTVTSEAPPLEPLMAPARDPRRASEKNQPKSRKSEENKFPNNLDLPKRAIEVEELPPAYKTFSRPEAAAETVENKTRSGQKQPNSALRNANIRERVAEILENGNREISKSILDTLVRELKRNIGISDEQDGKAENSYSKEEELNVRKSGISPLTNKIDPPPFYDLADRLREFYSHVKPSKINRGLGELVEWTMEHGEEELNKNLKKKYGVDLNTDFEKKEIAKDHQDDNEEEEKVVNNAKRSQGQRSQQEKSDHSENQRGIIKADSFKEWENEKVFKNAESYMSYGLTFEEKERLIAFLKKYEPNRLEKCLYIMVKYAKKHGVDALNVKLLKKYGDNIEKKEGVIIELDKTGEDLLLKYYSKYNPAFIENGGLQQVRIWTRRNGILALNEKLKEKYNESLEEFAIKAIELKEDLTKFYRKNDPSKSLKDIDQIVTWGLVNGVPAVNYNLSKKYGKDLSSVNGYPSTREAARARPF